MPGDLHAGVTKRSMWGTRRLLADRPTLCTTLALGMPCRKGAAWRAADGGRALLIDARRLQHDVVQMRYRAPRTKPPLIPPLAMPTAHTLTGRQRMTDATTQPRKLRHGSCRPDRLETP
ncbi:hypothetical protein BJD12_15740 [Xanthomonas vesicatoria ATCC 35937]|nr:hypothetical protein BJD12_15740 [Xanthomonas vesicatoria ATCC 35937]